MSKLKGLWCRGGRGAKRYLSRGPAVHTFHIFWRCFSSVYFCIKGTVRTPLILKICIFKHFLFSQRCTIHQSLWYWWNKAPQNGFSWCLMVSKWTLWQNPRQNCSHAKHCSNSKEVCVQKANYETFARNIGLISTKVLYGISMIICSNGLGLWCLMPQYFNNVTISFIGGGNQSIRRKPLTFRKSLTNFISLCCIKYTSPERDSKLQF